MSGIDYAQLLYLNPVLSSNLGIINTGQMAEYWGTASSAEKSNFAAHVPTVVDQLKPSQFFAMNLRSPFFDVVGIDAAIRSFATGTQSVYVPNVYMPGVIRSSNQMVFFEADSNLESLHVSSGYRARLLFPSGRTRPVTLSSVSRNSSNDLVISTVENDLIAENSLSFDRLNNIVLQGIFVSDPYRIMQVAACADVASNLAYVVPVQEFNASLYRLLYPVAQGMTADEAYADYLAAQGTRIGMTSELATVSTALRSSVPSLNVTGQADIAFLKIGSGNVAPIQRISRDFISEYQFCDDDTVVTERAIKTYSDRIRHMTMCNGYCLYDFSCRSNMTVQRNFRGSNASVSNLSAIRVNASNMYCSNVDAYGFTCYGPTLLTNSASLTVNCDATFNSLSRMDRATIRIGNLSEMTATSCTIVGNFDSAGAATFCNGVTKFLSGVNATGITCDTLVSVEDVISGRKMVAPSGTFSNMSSSNIATTRVSASDVDCESFVSTRMTTVSLYGQDIEASNVRTPSLTCSAANFGTSYSETSRSDTLSAQVANVRDMAVSGNASFQTTSVKSISATKASVETADVLAMTVTGRLDVKGYFLFPPDTYFENSNVSTGRLLVQQSANIASLTTDESMTSSFGLRKHTASSRSLRKPARETQSFRDLMGIDVSKIGSGEVDDSTCLRIAIEALQNLVKKQEK